MRALLNDLFDADIPRPLIAAREGADPGTTDDPPASAEPYVAASTTSSSAAASVWRGAEPFDPTSTT
jgi:hypothetical protein